MDLQWEVHYPLNEGIQRQLNTPYVTGESPSLLSGQPAASGWIALLAAQASYEAREPGSQIA